MNQRAMAPAQPGRTILVRASAGERTAEWRLPAATKAEAVFHLERRSRLLTSFHFVELVADAGGEQLRVYRKDSSAGRQARMVPVAFLAPADDAAVDLFRELAAGVPAGRAS